MTALRVKDCVLDSGHLYLIRERFNFKKVGVGNVDKEVKENGNGEDHDEAEDEEFEDVLPLKEPVLTRLKVEKEWEGEQDGDVEETMSLGMMKAVKIMRRLRI